MDSAQTLPTSLRRIKQLKLDELSEERVLAYFNNVWSVYGTIMGSLASDEAYYLFPNALRRPLIFYLGHTACFYVNKMIAAGLCTVCNIVFASHRFRAWQCFSHGLRHHHSPALTNM